MGKRKLDINTASVDEFASLSGIGQVKAKAIIDLRNELGQFTEVNDLQKVPGIGSVLMDQNRPILKCRIVKVKQRPKISKAARRIATGRAVGGRPLVKENPTLLVASNCNASLPTISFRRYNTRRNGLENISQDLTLSAAKKPKCQYRRRWKKVAGVRTVSLPQRSARRRRVDNQPPIVPANVEPCSSRGAGCESPSKYTSTSSSGETLALPGSSKCPGNFQNAQNPFLLRRRGFFHARRANPPHSAEDHGVVLRSSDAGGTGEVENACAQQTTSALDDDSAISTQSNLSISHEVPEKRWTKRKTDPSEDTRGPKKFCCSEENGPELQDEAIYEQQILSAADSPQSSSVRKQKIPSKKNPPPLLIGWLKTFQNWTHAERLLALDELMEICDPTEVRHVMQVIEPQFQRDFISLLPKELALYVLSFLEPNDLLRAAQTCRYWHMLAEDNILWREKCHEEGISESLVFGNIVRRKRPSSKSLWKSLFLRQQQIEKNWRASNRAPKVLKGHDDHVITCLEFNGMKIVSGSDDNTLKVWSAVTGKCLRTLTGHTGGVWSSQMSGNVIISGSTDRTLKVWDADTGRTIFTLYGHTSTVRCMHLHKNRVVSGSRDATLRMWDVETGHCLHVLIGHMAAVRCVQYDGRRVVSGAYDYMVKIWDPEKETCLQTLAGHTNRVYSLQFDGMHIVSGSLDTSIRVWSAETGACLHTLVGHQSLTSGMELKDNILVSGNADSTVKVWNITTGQCLQTLNGPNKHQSAVTCLQFNRKLIITSSDDGTIKIWDLRTGEFIRNLVTLESGGSGGVVWRIRCNNSKLVCAVGSRNGTEETKLLVLDFDVEDDAQNSGRAATVAAS